MARMDEERLLQILQAEEDDAALYANGTLRQERELSEAAYNREPYGDEVEGRSEFVTSDVEDAVQWILPSLLRIFTGGDETVSFDPTEEQDVDGAQQATDTCNYVFTKQNNGFLILHAAFHDALVRKNCAVHWYWKKTKDSQTQEFIFGSEEHLSLWLEENKKAKPEIVAAQVTEVPTQDPLAPVQQAIQAQIKSIKESGRVCVEAFDPDQLLVSKHHTTPLLDDARYVARIMPVTLGELREMGYKDVSAKDMDESDENRYDHDDIEEDNRNTGAEADDDSLINGYLRIEYVKVDFDGDGIPERRCVYRVGKKILSNEPCKQVQIATGSPILRPHRWSGTSLAESVEDIQRLHTTIIRQMLDGLHLANNSRKAVLVGPSGEPMANIDDLLDDRIGGLVRMKQPDAVVPMETQWVGAQAFPMLEYVSGMKENRTGTTRYNMGTDANSLNKTATGVNAIMSAAQARIDLMARLLAETVVKPIFQGIRMLLSENQGDEPLAYKLRNTFVRANPSEWKDQYDMTISVGLGTGNKDQQLMHLMTMAQMQAQAIASGGMGLLVTPKNVYNVQAKIAENAGFKNVGDFWTDPGDQMPQPQPDPKVEAEKEKAQLQIQADQAKHQQTLQADAHKFQAETEVERQKNEMQLQFEAIQKQLDRDHQIALEQIRQEFDLQRTRIIEENKARTADLNAETQAFASIQKDNSNG